LQDKTGVKMDDIQKCRWYFYNKMSDENREQITTFLQSIWGELLADISKSRNKTIAELNAVADNLWARNATLAVKNKIVSCCLFG
jgi:protease-4